MNILFICSKNKWRSRTAETIFKNNGLHQVQSAGTEPSARIKVTERMILWADVILVMEKKHQVRLLDRFSLVQLEEKIVVLYIPDEYQYMDEELIDELS